jgi:hypothetical protein
MTLNDRIAQFRTLISQRDDIDRQIAELLGDAALSVPATREPRQKRSKGAKKAPKQKQPRKMGKTRERVIELRLKGLNPRLIAEKIGLSESAVKYHIAKDAGSDTSGWASKKRKGEASEATSPAASPTLTADEFDELKYLQQIGDLSSKQFAETKRVPLAQVNRAIASASYEDYLNF